MKERNGMIYEITTGSEYGKCKFNHNILEFVADVSGKAFFEINLEFKDWDEDTFIFMPACAYNGNRFKKVDRPYPPRFLPVEYSLNPEKIINKLPSLNPDGSGEIEVTSVDIPFEFKQKDLENVSKKHILIFFCQK